MRISDWSSDVCSSDLLQARVDMNKRAERIDQERRDPRCSSRHCHRPNKRSAGRRTPCRQRPEHYSPELSEQRYTVRDRPRYHAVDQKTQDLDVRAGATTYTQPPSNTTRCMA